MAGPHSGATAPIRRAAGMVLVLAMVVCATWAVQGPAQAAGGACGDEATRVCRVSGAGRVETAVQVSAQYWDTAGHALLATATTFPDALAGGALAARLGAPLLLTTPTQLSPAVAGELSRLGTQTVTILGGPGAVGPAVEAQLAARGLQVRRLQGANRFATAAAIAREVGASPSGDVVLALGSHPRAASAWPDAVASGALAVTPDRVPTLLTGQSGLPPETVAALAALDPDTVIVVGGTSAVPDAIAEQVTRLGYTVRRLAGASRYETSALVAAEARSRFPAGTRPVVFATGSAFPDALSAAALAGRLQASLMLVPPADLPSDPAWRAVLATSSSPVSSGVVVGGPAAISEPVVTALDNTIAALPGPDPEPTEELPPPPDALGRRVQAELAVFTDWLEQHNVTGYIGEVAWPNSMPGDMDRWNALASAWYAQAEAADLWVTAWATGEWWPRDHDNSIYIPAEGSTALDTPRPQAPVLEGQPRPELRGINVAGGEFGAPGSGIATSTYSNANPGTYEIDWKYDGQASFDFLASRGVTRVRLPFRWERIQPTLGGPLDPAELTRLTAAVARAHSAGLEVILDVHNYGGYFLDDGSQGVRRAIGSAEVPITHFADLWRRLSLQFKDDPGVLGYGLMNEPIDLPALPGGTAAQHWELASQLALDAIRATGDKTTILVPGYLWSPAWRWSSIHPDPWITDPAGNIRYEAHHYFDRNRSSWYDHTYDEEVADAVAKGY